MTDNANKIADDIIRIAARIQSSGPVSLDEHQKIHRMIARLYDVARRMSVKQEETP